MRLIDADALRERISSGEFRNHSGMPYSQLDVMRILASAPTIDAAPVRRGEWKKEPYLLGWTHRCNRCGENYGMPHGMFNFCPNCGADMRGGCE